MLNQENWPKCRAWWSGSASFFLNTALEDIVGALSMAASERNLPPTPEMIESWKKTVEVLGLGLQHALTMDEKISHLGVLFEFEIPRRGRPDVVILSKNVALVVEFKVGSKKFERSAQIQVAEYVLDLLDYHSASHDMVITPALIATGANVSSEAADPLRGSLAIRNTAPADLGKLILETFKDDQMLAFDVFAHGGGRHLVVANGAHHAAPRRVERALQQPDQQAKNNGEHHDVNALDGQG